MFSRSRLLAMSSGVSNNRLGPVRKSEGPLRTYLPCLRLASWHTLQRQPTRGVVSAPPVPRNRSSSRLPIVAVSKTHPLIVPAGKRLSGPGPRWEGNSTNVHLVLVSRRRVRNRYVDPVATKEYRKTQT